MTEQELAAPSEAADEAAVSAVTEASEATENTEGQVEGQPAEGEETPEEISKSKARRERRQATEQRAREEKERLQAELTASREQKRLIEAALTGKKEPREADYDDPLVYAAARAVWQSKQEDREDEAAQAEAKIEAAQRAIDQAEAELLEDRKREFVEQLADARARYADYDAVSERAFIPKEFAPVVLECIDPHGVVYYLGKNPREGVRLSAMNPVAAALELGRIEAKLSAPRPKPTTSAPDPISPVRGTASGVKNPERMSPAEWRAAREAGWKP